MEAPGAPATTRPSRFSRPGFYLALELLMIFVGVYAASAMSDYDVRKKAASRRQQLEAALVQEIRDITSNTRRVATQLPVMLASFDRALAAGERPPLEPWIEPVRVDTHMWQVTLQSGAVDLFDVSMVYELSQFYNELNAGFEQLVQLRSLSETVLIPNLGSGSDEFYEPGTGALRPKYHWYRSGLERLGYLAASITSAGDSLVVRLEGASPGR